MPIYNFKCKECEHFQDELFLSWMNTEKRQAAANEEMTCNRCKAQSWLSVLSVPNLDSTSQTHRLDKHGYLSQALGRYVSSRKEEERIMAKRGFVCEADMPAHFWEDKSAAIQEKNNEQDAAVKRYTDVIDRGGSKEEAVEALAPTQEILSGKTDKLWSE
jgi:hypothetical protein